VQREHARTFPGNWKERLVMEDYVDYQTLFALGVSEIDCMTGLSDAELQRVTTPTAGAVRA
jgi:hypothetical protein